MANVMERAQEHADAIKQEARSQGERSGKQFSQMMLQKKAAERSTRIAHRVVQGAVVVLLILSLGALALSYVPMGSIRWELSLAGRIVAFIVSAVALLDLFDVMFVRRWIDKIEHALARAIMHVRYGDLLKELERAASEEAGG